MHTHINTNIYRFRTNLAILFLLSTSVNHISRGTQELGAEYTASLAIWRAPTSSASVWAEPKPALRRDLFFTVAAPLGFTSAGVQHLWMLNRSGLVVCRFVKSGRVRVRSWGIIWSSHGNGCNITL